MTRPKSLTTHPSKGRRAVTRPPARSVPLAIAASLHLRSGRRPNHFCELGRPGLLRNSPAKGGPGSHMRLVIFGICGACERSHTNIMESGLSGGMPPPTPVCLGQLSHQCALPSPATGRAEAEGQGRARAVRDAPVIGRQWHTRAETKGMELSPLVPLIHVRPVFRAVDPMMPNVKSRPADQSGRPSFGSLGCFEPH